eukprot:scaffold6103_cov146-Skeletonema_menzelii.AAC.16
MMSSAQSTVHSPRLIDCMRDLRGSEAAGRGAAARPPPARQFCILAQQIFISFRQLSTMAQ